MPWTLYQSTDPSAPSLGTSAGDFLDVLRAILVTGYGAKPGAGWSEEYTGANVAVFRQGAAAVSRKYWRVVDDGSGAGGAAEAGVRGYDTMSDISTGTAPFPTIAQLAEGVIIRKVDASWMAVADERTLIFFRRAFSAPLRFAGMYIGEIVSRQPGDTQCSALIGRNAPNQVSNGYERLCWANTTTPTSFSNQLADALGHYLSGSHAGVAGSVTFGKLCHPLSRFSAGSSSSWDLSGGAITYPNPVDGGIALAPFTVYHGAVNFIRGRLRGIWLILHDPTNFSTGDTFDGAGELAGRSFVIINCAGSAIDSTSVGSGCIAVETTPPDVTP